MSRNTQILLSRDDFRAQVFGRDGGLCVMCQEKAVDAHHIIDRSLFDDGGYYLDNGASVCQEHHWQSELTLISCEDLRHRAKIQRVVLPKLWASDDQYDKWGNVILPDQTRLAGPKFHEPSVQKLLREAGVLELFRPWVKYPRTPHLPWSKSLGDDDFVLEKSPWAGMDVVVTEKMDGENTTMYHDHIHARSLSSGHHPSRSWVKQLWSGIKNDIPRNWRLCGENLYAEHSIHYDDLPSYFLLFSVWNEKNQCLSWDDTQQWADLLELNTVPVLYRGPYDQTKIERCWNPSLGERQEGYVIRPAGEFSLHEFSSLVAKFVRPAHVTSSKHWMHQSVKPNGLKKS